MSGGERAGGKRAGGKQAGVLNGCYHSISMLGHYALVGFERVADLFFKRRQGRARLINYGASALLVIFVAVSVFYYLMGWRALSVAFLKPQIEAALATSFGDADVRIDDVLLQRDTERGGLFLRLTNMVIRGGDRETIAASPETAIGLKFLPLMVGQVEADSLNLIGPEVHMVRNDQGDWTLWRKPRGLVSEELLGESIAVERRPAGEQTGKNLAQLGDIVAASLGKAHNQLQKSINLSNIGVLKARVVLHPNDRPDTSADDAKVLAGDVWYIPSFTIQYDPDQEKRLIGSGVIQREDAPGSGMWVSVAHREGDQFVDVKTELENVVPSDLSSLVPVLQSLRPVHVGVSGKLEARVHLTDGLLSGNLTASVAEGHIGLLGEGGPVIQISRGAFEFVMEGDARHIVLKRGDLIYPSGQISLKGDIWGDGSGEGPKDWRFQLNSTGGNVISAIDGSVHEIKEFSFAGQLFKAKVPISIDEMRARIGESSVLIAHDGSEGYPAILRGRMANVPLGLFKSIWPEGYRPEGRAWVFENVKSGVIQSGSFALEAFGVEEPALISEPSTKKTPLPSMTLNVRDLSYTIFDDPLLVRADAAVVEFEGISMTATIEKGFTTVPDGGAIEITAGRLHIPDYEPTRPMCVMTFNINASAPTLMTLLKRDPFKHDSLLSEKAEAIDGTVTGSLSVTMPMAEEMTEEDVKAEGQLVLAKGQAKVGKFSITNSTVNFLLGPNYIEAKGNMLINGVPADIDWRRQIVVGEDYVPPPLLIRGVYDEADRNQLGLAVNELVQGAVPVELVMQQTADETFDMKVSADLTKATITSKALGWRKEAGVAASLDFDIEPDGDGGARLSNFRIEGQELTARGEITLDENSAPTAFTFPKISYQVVSNITMKGTLGKDKVWKVLATGKTYDGRGILKSLLRTGQVGGAGNRASGGMDLIAKFDTVIGWQQSRLSDFQINMKRRGDQLADFAVDGTLRNGGSLKARQVSSDGDDPVILFETSDAGEALRFVGFYPNMLGGTGQLSVRYNVKKRQLASKTGQLVISRFSIASDPVVREVLANAGSGKKGKIAGQDIIPFSRLVAPFSIGHEQFILHDSYVSGELLGATMRGSLDFQNERVRLGGTYIPLYGLNAAVGAVPVLGDILVGRRGEGMLGITFGIYGNINKPEVLVNPMSLVAPGVFRQIFEFEQGNQQIRERPVKPKKPLKKLDSSASPPVRRKQGAEARDRKSAETSASTVIRRSE